MDRIRTLILGAAGRDFHNFNVVYRDDTRYEVFGFTAAQIPNIADRRYPADLAGPLYPAGVPIFPPVVRASYELQEIGHPDLSDALDAFVRKCAARSGSENGSGVI